MSLRLWVAPTLAAVLCTLQTVSASAQSTAPGFALDRFEPSERGSDWFAADSLDFRVPVVRPQLRGNVLRPWITFLVQPELAGTPRLLDAEVTKSPSPWFGVRYLVMRR